MDKFNFNSGLHIILFLVAGFCATSVKALELIPLSVSPLNPFSINFTHLPAHIWKDLTDNKTEIDIRVEMGNFSIQSESAGEKIILDGEVYKSTLGYRYPLNNQLVGSISIPLIRYSSGFMDHGIEQWHDGFGLSNERRSGFGSNELHFEYLDNNVSQVKVISSSGGLGDINLGLSYQVQQQREGQRGLAFNLDVKLPTGEVRNLMGNGAIDLGLSVHAIKNNLGEQANFSLTGALGVMLLGDGELLSQRQKEISYAVYAGLHWMPVHKLLLSAQLHQQSSLFKSNLNELGKGATQLVIGCSVEMDSGQNIQVALGENLFTDASPDFSVLLSIQFNQRE